MGTVTHKSLKLLKISKRKSRKRETLNLSTNADSSTNIFVSAGVKKGADSIFLGKSYIENNNCS